MKRHLFKISDDKWVNHPLKHSGALKVQKRIKVSPPPPIESFTFRKPAAPIELLSDSSGDSTANKEILDDNDAEEASSYRNNGRRFVVDEDDYDECNSGFCGADKEFCDISSSEGELGSKGVLQKALLECSKISEELKNELSGCSTTCLEHLSAGETAPTGIVTQDDIHAACGVENPDLLVLKPYQLVGVNFLLLLHRKGIGGAILADEMGLGKTIQAITYLKLLKHLNNDSGPHLIVCPASILENWERELKKWCPAFSVLQFHGDNRSAYSKKLHSSAKFRSSPTFNVLLVCYSLFERHGSRQKDDRKLLKCFPWSCVLIDEAHALKDKSSYRWKNLASVAKKANQRLMLTGTPLQNDLHELWSLLEFMMPDVFASNDLELKTLLNMENKDFLIHQMKSILGPLVLRRLKADVMEQLVSKHQFVEYVFMEKTQAEAYMEVIAEYRAVSHARLKNISNENMDTVVGVLPQRQITNYFFQLRKIANHPLLVRRIYSDEDIFHIANKLHSIGYFGLECKLDRVVEELKDYDDFSIHQLLLSSSVTDPKESLQDNHVMLSAKCQALYRLIPSLKETGHRVLIFSQWTSMLDILEWALDIIGVSYLRLDGSTPVADRQMIVDTFNGDASIFACLLSTRAGGQGLNLTGADTVIIHDMDFNPQIDRQAEDRCHRIGQTKPVSVYRLVTKDTVDENVHEIATRKLQLDAAVLESDGAVDCEDGAATKSMGKILASLLMG